MSDFHRGSLEVVCGPMFSGKSEELIRRINRVRISGKKFLLFKPSIDDRYDANNVTSHDQRRLEAITTGTDAVAVMEIESIVRREDPEVIAFDECCFYGMEIIPAIMNWVDEGRRVIVVGLDTDFRGETFGPMGELLARADHADKLKAICMKCRQSEAAMTQRLVNGQPARHDDPTIVVGGFDSYEARCRKCHEI
ncbi:MAG TPA: thymidine kinase [archaeon]|nr:thymidine kinase [archaeon]